MIERPPHRIPSDRPMTALEAQELQKWLEKAWLELQNLENRVAALEAAAHTQ